MGGIAMGIDAGSTGRGIGEAAKGASVSITISSGPLSMGAESDSMGPRTTAREVAIRSLTLSIKSWVSKGLPISPSARA